jgi:hypothetical protein
MANLAYSAKPASEWTENELRLFSIEIVDKDIRSFFGCPIRSPNTVGVPYHLPTRSQPLE